MHIDNSFLGLVFSATLFILIAYKIYSFVKAYCIPFLLQQVREVQKQQMELLQTETLLASTLKRVDNQLFQQKKMAVLLEKKVQLWHRAMSDKKADEEKEYKLHLLRVIEKRKIQEKQLFETKMVLEVVPSSVKIASDELLATHRGKNGIVL